MSPGRRRVNHSVPRPMTRKWIVMMPVAASVVLSENGPAQDHAREVAGPDVDELARPRAAREVGRVVGLEPLARQDLPTLDEFRRGEPHAHAVGSSSASSAASSTAPPAASSSAASPLSSGADRREGLGERVGQVAEDVGRVVELDELVGAREHPPLPAGILGDDLGAERARSRSGSAARRRRRR